jgi:hypothetical protein
MNTFDFTYGITNPTLWWDLTFESTNKLLANMKEKVVKEVEIFIHTIHLAPTTSTSTNPKSSKNARKV